MSGMLRPGTYSPFPFHSFVSGTFECLMQMASSNLPGSTQPIPHLSCRNLLSCQHVPMDGQVAAVCGKKNIPIIGCDVSMCVPKNPPYIALIQSWKEGDSAKTKGTLLCQLIREGLEGMSNAEFYPYSLGHYEICI